MHGNFLCTTFEAKVSACMFTVSVFEMTSVGLYLIMPSMSVIICIIIIFKLP